MRSLYISRTNGTMRISRFRSAEIQPTVEPRQHRQHREAKPFENLTVRCHAPLKLTVALQARLPCRSYHERREREEI